MAVLNGPCSHDVTKPTVSESIIVESWAQGYMVGSLVIMAAVTIANMRRGVLLHKLILLELILGTFMGFFMFFNPPVYGWYLSASAIPLNISWILHNVISWMKIKPFLSKRWSKVFIGTVVLSIPYWIVEIYANFTYFNNINCMFETTRPYEAIFRDPWWVFTTGFLFYQIGKHYKIPLPELVSISPRFGMLLGAMILSIIFILLDILSVTNVFSSALPDGLNPFWKLAFVFKCLTDSIVLDDFKTALDRLMRHKLRRERIADEDGHGHDGHTDTATIGSSGGGTIATAERFGSLGFHNGDPITRDWLFVSDTVDTRRHTIGSRMSNFDTEFERAKVWAEKKNRGSRDSLDNELASYAGGGAKQDSGTAQHVEHFRERNASQDTNASGNG